MQTSDRSDISGLPVPLDLLASSFEPGEHFTSGAAKLAAFLSRVKGEYPAATLFELLLDPFISRKWQEFVLYCLFDIGYSDIQIAQQALRLKTLRRLYQRWQSGVRISVYEQRIIKLLQAKIQVDNVPNLLACGFFARKVTALMFRRMYVHDTDRKLVVLLLRAEAAATRARLVRLSRAVDTDSPEVMAQRLPLLHLFGENVRTTLDLSTRLWRGATVGHARMTVERVLTPSGMDDLMRDVLSHNNLTALHQCLTLQRRKLVPTQSLVALSTLCRWILAGKGTEGTPLLWIHSALNLYDGGSFAVDAGDAATVIGTAVEGAGATISGKAVRGSFSTRLYTQWLGHDLLTRPLPASVMPSAVESSSQPDEALDAKDEVDVKDLIRLHLNNDALIAHLLDKPRVFNTPGLVEFIAVRSRSLSLLTRIATRPELHSGSANRNVPKALIANPSPIPIGLLRKFLKPGFFGARELKALISTSGTIRSQVVAEIKSVLEKM